MFTLEIMTLLRISQKKKRNKKSVSKAKRQSLVRLGEKKKKKKKKKRRRKGGREGGNRKDFRLAMINSKVSEILRHTCGFLCSWCTSKISTSSPNILLFL